jgi:hypothetical protein
MLILMMPMTDLDSLVEGNKKRWSKESKMDQGHTHSRSGVNELGYCRVGSGEMWGMDQGVAWLLQTQMEELKMKNQNRKSGS